MWTSVTTVALLRTRLAALACTQCCKRDLDSRRLCSERLFAGDPSSPRAFASKTQLPCCSVPSRPQPSSMAKRARNPDVPEVRGRGLLLTHIGMLLHFGCVISVQISEATRLAFKSELAEKVRAIYFLSTRLVKLHVIRLRGSTRPSFHAVAVQSRE